ncbi:MAG: hypothetical protein QXX33_00470 [Candidatus Hadarchaeales archaeon]
MSNDHEEIQLDEGIILPFFIKKLGEGAQWEIFLVRGIFTSENGDFSKNGWFLIEVGANSNRQYATIIAELEDTLL